MLIYRKRGNKPLVGITDDMIHQLSETCDLCEMRAITVWWPMEDNIPPLNLFPFEEFLKAVGPDDIREAGDQLGVWEWLR